MADNRWIPNLSGKVDPQVEQFLRYIALGLYDLRDGKAGPAGSNAPATKITGGDLVGSPPLLITKGPGRGTYVVGAKVSPGGSPGTITLDDNGRVVGISVAN